jgi:DNA-binding protein HU-beta
MNRPDVVDALVERTGMTRAQANAMLTAFGEILADAVAARTPVRLPGLMTVQTADRAARVGRNPRTGEPVDIAARTAVRITPGAGLTAAANGATA